MFTIDCHSYSGAIITHPQSFPHKDLAITLGQQLLDVYPVVIVYVSTRSVKYPRKIVATLSQSQKMSRVQ